MSTVYPNAYDDSTTLPPATGDDAISVNAIITSVLAIEHELGLVPAGVYASVRARLDILETRIGGGGGPPTNIPNPFFIGNSGVSIGTGTGVPTQLANSGSIFLRQDAVTAVIYFYGDDGMWHQVGADINGASVPVGGALTTGNVLQVSGPDSLTYGPVNLAGGSNYVTGVLPIGNQASQTMGGDVTGTTAASTVSKIQGVVISGTPVTGYVLEATSSSAATWQNPSTSLTLGGDVTGSAGANTVGKIQNNTVTGGALTKGQFFVATSTSNWAATTLSGDVSESGVTAGLLTMTGIQSVPVANTSPVQSAVPVYDTVVTKYDIRQLTQDDIGPGFTITSFTGGSIVEVGATVTNPSFTASYSTAAASASITNTDGLDSPHVLTTPFTSATIIGSFTHNTITSVTFTLSATAAVTKTANQFISYLARTFSGVGTAGATSATASGNNATLVGASGTLTGTSPDGGLFSSIVGQVFGSFSPSSQKIYILTPHTGSAHTFKDQNGFTFAMNVPTTFSFTNQNSSSISMDLYESTNLLSTNFTITVVT